MPSIDSALSGLKGQDHTPTPVTYCTLRCCLARGRITDCMSSGGEQISLNQFALLHLLKLHTKCSDFTILTSLHLIWDGFELKWWYCFTLDLLLCRTTMEHGHRATILHSVSVIRCHRAGRAAPSLCGYCKLWRESHPSIACPHSVTITTVGGTHAHISMHHLLHTVLKTGKEKRCCTLTCFR